MRVWSCGAWAAGSAAAPAATVSKVRREKRVIAPYHITSVRRMLRAGPRAASFAQITNGTRRHLHLSRAACAWRINGSSGYRSLVQASTVPPPPVLAPNRANQPLRHFPNPYLLSQIYFRMRDEMKAKTEKEISLRLRRENPTILEAAQGRPFPASSEK